MTNNLSYIEEDEERSSGSETKDSKDGKGKKKKFQRFKKRRSELHIKERPPEFCQAMSRQERIRTYLSRLFSRNPQKPREDNDSEEKTEEDLSFRQFTISRKYKKSLKNDFRHAFTSAHRTFFTFGSVRSLNNVNAGTRFGIFPNPNKVLIDFLNWMYSTSFYLLFSFCALFFYVITISFALIIMLLGEHQEQCINIGESSYGKLTKISGFVGAFTLSWTTLSTVGYGNTSPSVEEEECLSVNFLLMLESFIGVTYAGFCGAILFGKLMRFQSRATVVFSDPVVIRYGMGLNDQDDFEIEETQIRKNKTPVLEFRVLNLMHEEPGGEIMSAVLNVVASSHKEDNIQEHTVEIEPHREAAQDELMSEYSDHPDVDNPSSQSTHNLKRRKRKKLKQVNGTNRRSDALFDEGHDKLIPKIVFSTLQIVEPHHPLFKRTWVGKHRLDKESPLLKENVKKMLWQNGNQWPDELYDAKGIKDSLEFNQIIVSITGVSNVSGSDVYAHNIYDFNDVVIGFEFVDLLVFENDKPKVDMDALHCVVEQVGGGSQRMDVLCSSHHDSSEP